MREEKEKILNEVFRLLNEKYPVGLYEYLYENHRATYDAILRVEDKVDQAFLTGTLAELKEALYPAKRNAKRNAKRKTGYN